MSDDEDTSSSGDDQPVEVAVLARGRRATAGRRLTTLTGQAADDDDAFWGHDTWGDEDDGSFRESDEDSQQREDTFDSDFDDDEVEEVDAEKQNAAKAEAEIAREEKDDRKKKRGFAEPTKKRPTMRRIIGEGLNAGIVLNAPGKVPLKSAAAAGRPVGAKTTSPIAPTFATVAATRKPRRSTAQSKYSSRFRSTKHNGDAIADSSQSTQHQAVQSAPQLGQSSQSNKRKLTAAERAGDKKKPKRFTQEELLLEAIHRTEPENRRWLLERQRNQTEKDEAHQQAMDRKNQNSGKLVERYISRRGALNLVHFPSVDHVPEILKGQKAAKPRPEIIKCAITGYPARYRDPRTGLPYYDTVAFKEIRRRYGTKKAAPETASSSNPQKAATTTKLEDTTLALSQQNLSAGNASVSEKSAPKKKKVDPKKIDEQKLENGATNAGGSEKVSVTKKPELSKNVVNLTTAADEKTSSKLRKATDTKNSAATRKRKTSAQKQENGSKAAKRTPEMTPSSSSNQNGAHTVANVPIIADLKIIAADAKESSSPSATPSAVQVEFSNPPSHAPLTQRNISASPSPHPPPLSNPTSQIPSADSGALKVTSASPSKKLAASSALKDANPPDSPGRRASPRRKRPSAKVLDGAPSIPH